MNRRKFIKYIGMGVLGVGLPIVTVAKRRKLKSNISGVAIKERQKTFLLSKRNRNLLPLEQNEYNKIMSIIVEKIHKDIFTVEGVLDNKGKLLKIRNNI